jgi:Na+/melibiose symporter-like transporter
MALGGRVGQDIKEVCYNQHVRNFIQITAFILIIVGTAGLLLNEFAWEHSSTLTIIFGVVNLVGLVNLAFAFFGMREKPGA